MNKDGFLRQLRLSLQGRLSYDTIEERIRWYEDYILMHIRKGKSEAEVLALLGDPRLLADSVVSSMYSKEDRLRYDDEWEEK